ncbi:hypothetical protein K439DRAFT_1169024 [Ramaria rubella]|nr:hypothetical protein K439DRAFT_1169024 [Ramaria rubella]
METIPLDSVQLFVKTYIRLGWIVKGHIDVIQAKEALEAVVRRWRILGARIQGNGKATPFHLSIPQEFGPSAPPFSCTHSTSSEPLSDIYPFSSSSEFSSRIYVKPPLSVFSPSPDISLKFPPSPSAPLIGLHIGHYPGLTVVGLRVSHVVFDAITLGIVLREWETALRDIEAYKAKGENKTPVGRLGVSPWLEKNVTLEPGWMPAGWSTLTLRKVCSIAGTTFKQYLADKLMRSYERRVMTIPNSFFERIKTDVYNQLLRRLPKGHTFKISTADVIQSWLWKHILSNKNSKSSTLTLFFSIASCRDILDYARVPCFNTFAIILTPPLPVHEAKFLSSLDLILHSRRALQEQRNPEMLTKLFKWLENKPKLAWPIQEGKQVMGMVSNTCKSDIDTIDLSPAVDKETGNGQVLHSFLVDDTGMANRVNGFLVGKTPDGRAFTIHGRTHKAVWESMRESVEHTQAGHGL